MKDKSIVRLEEAIVKDPDAWNHAMDEMTEEQNDALVAIIEMLTKPIILAGQEKKNAIQ